jgi:hypothetical protein
MGWEAGWAGAAVAREFVRRLSELDPAVLWQAIPPVLDRDPYLSAWTNIQAALGAAPAIDQARIRELLSDLDSEIKALNLAPSITVRRRGCSGDSWCAGGS